MNVVYQEEVSRREKLRAENEGMMLRCRIGDASQMRDGVLMRRRRATIHEKGKERQLESKLIERHQQALNLQPIGF